MRSRTNGVLVTVFPLYCVFEPFVSGAVICLFEILKMFYPPKGFCESRFRMGGPFDSLSILLCLRKGVWTFRFSGGNPPFQNLENVLSPEGTAIAEPNGVNLGFCPFYCIWKRVFGPFVSLAPIRLFLILKMFYPPQGSAKAHPMGSN